ncbi:MAG: hypothetical protein JWM73_2988, partial [Solirubrobacterales bacterium]|nr:hypothetical protein [Solirubrobacterales bacterium]
MWRKVLDPRLYRAAFAPILLALVVAAFSLVERPHALTTTLAPDAFDGAKAFARLQGLAAQFPDRRPGSPGDVALARRVEQDFRSALCPKTGASGACDAVSVRNLSGHTIDGEADLETVVATRLGAPGPGIMVVAHRDAAGRPAEAALSGTAALLELARVFGGRRTVRTLTLVSTSGGSGGAAGAAQLAAHMPGDDPRPDAVLVLGDVASANPRRPWVMPWSDGSELAPVRLRRTAEAALKLETGADPGQPRAIAQLARLAFPFAQTEQAPFNEAGIPALAFQASAERGPADGAAVSAARLRGFGRGVLRTIDALDNGPTLTEAPSAEVVVLGKVLPPWVARLLVGVLLLPMLVAAVDGLARVRRRKAAVAVWLRWLLAFALPFAAAAFVARLLGLTGVLDQAPADAVPAGLVPVDGLAVAIVAVVFVLAAFAVRPLQRALASRPESAPAIEREGGGPASALTLAITLLAIVVWIVNPFAAAVLVLPAHLWMLAAVPEVRLRPVPALALVLVALLPAALVLAVYANAIGASPAQLPWSLLLLVAGGQVGALSLLVLCATAACAIGAFRLALL